MLEFVIRIYVMVKTRTCNWLLKNIYKCTERIMYLYIYKENFYRCMRYLKTFQISSCICASIYIYIYIYIHIYRVFHGFRA